MSKSIPDTELAQMKGAVGLIGGRVDESSTFLDAFDLGNSKDKRLSEDNERSGSDKQITHSRFTVTKEIE